MDYQPQLQSRLLSSPRELRDQIYELTFSNMVVRIRPQNYAEHYDSKVPADRNAGLLLASKQLHNETTLLYYKHTSFKFDSVKLLRRWLSASLSKHLAVIRDIAIDGEFWFREQAMREKMPSYLENSRALLGEGVIGVLVYERVAGKSNKKLVRI